MSRSEGTTLRRAASPGHRSFGPEGPPHVAASDRGPKSEAVTVQLVARKKHPPISDDDRAVIGALLREVRRAAGYRSAETAAAAPGCPASRQTIYAYERGGLVPSLVQFLELVEFYVLGASPSPATGRKPEPDLRALGVAAVTQSAHPSRLPRDRGSRPDRAHATHARPQRRGAAVVTIELIDIDHVGIAVPDLEAAVERLPAPARRRALAPRARRRPGRRGGAVRRRLVVRAAARRPRPRHAGRPIARLAGPRPASHRLPGRRRRGRARAPSRGRAPQLIDEAPRPGSRDTLIAFVHPRSMGGVLVELVQER